MNPHPAWEVLQHHIAMNVPEYVTLFSAICIAAVCSMPKNIPTSFGELWTWMRDTLQTAVPAARAQHQVSVQTTETPTQKTVTASETTADPTKTPEKP